MYYIYITLSVRLPAPIQTDAWLFSCAVHRQAGAGGTMPSCCLPPFSTNTYIGI